MKHLIIFFLLFLICCQQAVIEEEWSTVLELPVNSSLSNIALVNDEVHISWVESTEKEDVLLFKNITSQSKNREVARSSNWFVNWADFPGLTSFKNGNLLTYWLEMSGEGTYDYDVSMSLSNSQGDSWSEAKIVHNDGVSSEHGFVSTCQFNNDIMMVWLDGRDMISDESHGGHSHGNGAMTLRSAIVSPDGKIANRQLIDNKVCECCHTDVTMAECGPIAVYRNRTDKESRDAYYVRYLNGDWTDPRPLDTINWKINGCPVNGPRIAANDNLVAATWFTVHDSLSTTRLAISNNCGQSFGNPITIDKNKRALGRLDIAFHKDDIVVSSMKAKKDTATVQLDVFDINGIRKRNHTIGKTSSSRKSGFPRIISDNSSLYVSYTDVFENRVKIKSLR